jgi:hypothetical protein
MGAEDENAAKDKGKQKGKKGKGRTGEGDDDDDDGVAQPADAGEEGSGAAVGSEDDKIALIRTGCAEGSEMREKITKISDKSYKSDLDSKLSKICRALEKIKPKRGGAPPPAKSGTEKKNIKTYLRDNTFIYSLWEKWSKCTELLKKLKNDLEKAKKNFENIPISDKEKEILKKANEENKLEETPEEKMKNDEEKIRKLEEALKKEKGNDSKCSKFYKSEVQLIKVDEDFMEIFNKSAKYLTIETKSDDKGNGKFKFNIEKTDKIPKMGEYLLFRPPAKSELEENDEMLQLKEELRKAKKALLSGTTAGLSLCDVFNGRWEKIMKNPFKKKKCDDTDSSDSESEDEKEDDTNVEDSKKEE